MSENPQDPGYLPPAPADQPQADTPIYQEAVEQQIEDPTFGNPSDVPTTGPDQPNN